MQQILDKLKVVRDHNSQDLNLNETSLNPWTQKEETLGETLVDIRKQELERRKIQLEVELIGIKGGGDADVMEVGGAELTIYDNVDSKTGETCWGDLCRGPHVPDTRYIASNAFKLMRTAAATQGRH